MDSRRGDSGLLEVPFIWYELMARDPEGAKAFYESVLGWQIGEPLPGGVEYRLIAAGSENVGGMLHLTDAMCEEGASPTWLGYIGVENVDATLVQLEKLGGRVLMPAMDIPDVGRLALVADTEGAPFYVMCGAVEGGISTAFQAMAPGHCSWNELTTADQDGALNFYGALFGWISTEGMPLSDTLEYRFLDCGDTRFGALSPCMDPGSTPGWNYYFYVPDIDAAGANAEGGGGRILHGPHQIPGGDYILIGADPEGAAFSLVGPRPA